jgi:hypothetical protein
VATGISATQFAVNLAGSRSQATANHGDLRAKNKTGKIAWHPRPDGVIAAW